MPSMGSPLSDRRGAPRARPRALPIAAAAPGPDADARRVAGDGEGEPGGVAPPGAGRGELLGSGDAAAPGVRASGRVRLAPSAEERAVRDRLSRRSAGEAPGPRLARGRAHRRR